MRQPLAPDNHRIVVVAGILIEKNDNILLTERVGDTQFVDHWEFPGGKVAKDETLQQALCRELAEEIGIQVVDAQPFRTLDHDYADRSVRLHFYLVRSWRGIPAGRESQRLRWVSRTNIDADSLLPADRPIVEALLAVC